MNSLVVLVFFVFSPSFVSASGKEQFFEDKDDVILYAKESEESSEKEPVLLSSSPIPNSDQSVEKTIEQTLDDVKKMIERVKVRQDSMNKTILSMNTRLNSVALFLQKSEKNHKAIQDVLAELLTNSKSKKKKEKGLRKSL